jgi:hypothetical protein
MARAVAESLAEKEEQNDRDQTEMTLNQAFMEMNGLEPLEADPDGVCVALSFVFLFFLPLMLSATRCCCSLFIFFILCFFFFLFRRSHRTAPRAPLRLPGTAPTSCMSTCVASDASGCWHITQRFLGTGFALLTAGNP